VDLSLERMRRFAAAGILLNFTYDELSPSDAGEPLFPNSVGSRRPCRAGRRRGAASRAPRPGGFEGGTVAASRAPRPGGFEGGTVAASRAPRPGGFEGGASRPPFAQRLISCATRSRWYVASPKVNSDDLARLK
jgi:hypothetical protein